MQLGIEKRMVPHIPWALVGTVMVIGLLGLYNLASASRPPNSVWTSQALYLGVSVAAALTVALFDLRFIYRITPWVYGLNILMLIGLHFLGHTAKGAESWFIIGPFRLQPAEFMKVGILMMLARYFHESYRPTDDTYGLRRLLVPGAIIVVPTVLVLVQPDLGGALMIAFSSATVILFARPRRWMVITLGVALAAGSVVLWNDYVREQGDNPHYLVRNHLKKHQSNRISGWLDPETDLRGFNYHAAQSRIAVGSGGLWGKGWRNGTQTMLSFLPEQHTDFIFSVWAEEHGFLACLLLIVLYGALLVLTLSVAFDSKDRYGAFFAVGCAALIFWQVFENIGMIVGVLPVTGITLPLMSYGGSSLMSIMLMVGLLVNISMRRHMF
ncbi:MAG TPA: rod shape-determining protein RodA [Myxococcaceae bacterium]|nr:rod shape-determining protein RodA [Myxococcaceae bacterium]